MAQRLWVLACQIKIILHEKKEREQYRNRDVLILEFYTTLAWNSCRQKTDVAPWDVSSSIFSSWWQTETQRLCLKILHELILLSNEESATIEPNKSSLTPICHTISGFHGTIYLSMKSDSSRATIIKLIR